MKVCHFGTYDMEFPRTKIIVKGLKKNGVEVLECNDPSYLCQNVFRLLPKYLRLIKKHLSIENYDAMLVGPNSYDVPLAKLLVKILNKPLVYDVWFSGYESLALDKKIISPNSLKAKFYHLMDYYSCNLADVVIVDTQQDINYFCEEFGFGNEKFRRIFIGADDDVFYPRDVEIGGNEYFKVIFHGSFIPIQGLEYIVKAAKLLDKEKIKFEIIGSGMQFEEIRQLSNSIGAKNVSFKGHVNYKDLPYYISKGDVCLGIFGDSYRARRLIPHKAFEILAMKKPLITGDSPAAREVLVNKKNAILCEMVSPDAIADAILLLREEKGLRKTIAENGYRLFKERFTTEAIGGDVKKVIEEII